jgi:hemerythrin-like domain-containing protein
MPRYNTFNHIHKALRALLYNTALCLQQTDFGTKEECDAAVEKVVAVLDLFEAHAQQEDHHILPALFDFEPSVADAFEQEHVKDEKLSQALYATIAEIYRTTVAAEKLRLGRRLTAGFIQFMIFNLNHMAKEEDVLNNLLWRYYTDAEIKAIERVIRENTPPEKQPFVAQWMLRGLSNVETVSWLTEVQQQAPAALFDQIIAMAQSELPGSRFQQIAAHFSKATLA